MGESPGERGAEAAATDAGQSGGGALADQPDSEWVGRRGRPEPGRPYLFTPGESLPAEEAVAAMFGAQTGLVSPDDNLAVMPALSSDPAAVLEGEISPTARLEPRPYGRLIAPRRRSKKLTIELVAAKPAPRLIVELLTDHQVEIPSGWKVRRGRLASKRRIVWLEVPTDARPREVLGFLCSAVGAIAPDSATGRFLLVRSRSSGLGGLSSRND